MLGLYTNPQYNCKPKSFEDCVNDVKDFPFHGFKQLVDDFNVKRELSETLTEVHQYRTPTMNH
jgi:hypothetical protein